MSSDPTAFDPYRSPAMPEGLPLPATGSKRPGWLTALCVIAIVIGILGFANGVIGFFSVVFGQELQSAFTPAAPPNMPQGLQKVQQDFQAEVQAVQGRFFVQMLTSAIFRVIVAVLLFIGGVLCLSLKPRGRQLLLIACGMAIVFEVLTGFILHSLINMEMMTAFNALLDGMAEEMPQRGNTRATELVLNIMRFSIVGGFIIQYIIVLLKLAFYTFGVIYLQRASIKAVFASAAADAAAVQVALK